MMICGIKKVQSFRNYNCPTVQEGMFFKHSEDELYLTVRSSFRVAIKVMSGPVSQSMARRYNTCVYKQYNDK